MGLIPKDFMKRIGKNFAGQFGDSAAHAQNMSQYERWRNPPWSMSDYMVNAPATYTGVGAGTGALWGAAAGSQTDPAGGALAGAKTGAAVAGGAAAAAISPILLKRLIVSVAKAMAQRAPDQPQEVIMQQAQKVVSETLQRPDARAQVEKLLGQMKWPDQ